MNKVNQTFRINNTRQVGPCPNFEERQEAPSLSKTRHLYKTRENVRVPSDGKVLNNFISCRATGRNRLFYVVPWRPTLTKSQSH